MHDPEIRQMEEYIAELQQQLAAERAAHAQTLAKLEQASKDAMELSEALENEKQAGKDAITATELDRNALLKDLADERAAHEETKRELAKHLDDWKGTIPGWNDIHIERDKLKARVAELERERDEFCKEQEGIQSNDFKTIAEQDAKITHLRFALDVLRQRYANWVVKAGRLEKTLKNTNDSWNDSLRENISLRTRVQELNNSLSTLAHAEADTKRLDWLFEPGTTLERRFQKVIKRNEDPRVTIDALSNQKPTTNTTT